LSRTTLIFGNGLGMALDPERFALDSAIGSVWEGEVALDEATKALVRHCLVADGNTDRPHGEEDLDNLQLVVSACEFLSRTASDIHWLSEHGLRFPSAVRKFLYRTALYFHRRDIALPLEFTAPLAEFVHATRSHIATLNYDNLLYQPMIEAKVLDGYAGALVDGLLPRGFSEENLHRKYDRSFGYYMHLHGLPLFVDRDECITKLRQAELGEDDDVLGSHIVLTHVKHKETVIAASPLLSCYWEYLGKALAESVGVVLVGYSGCDRHLNALLRAQARAEIRVVEWEGAGDAQTRAGFWTELLGRPIELVRLPSILAFTDW